MREQMAEPPKEEYPLVDIDLDQLDYRWAKPGPEWRMVRWCFDAYVEIEKALADYREPVLDYKAERFWEPIKALVDDIEANGLINYLIVFNVGGKHRVWRSGATIWVENKSDPKAPRIPVVRPQGWQERVTATKFLTTTGSERLCALRVLHSRYPERFGKATCRVSRTWNGREVMRVHPYESVPAHTDPVTGISLG